MKTLILIMNVTKVTPILLQNYPPCFVADGCQRKVETTTVSVSSYHPPQSQLKLGQSNKTLYELHDLH